MESYGAQVNAGEHRARVRIECSTKFELFS